MLPERDRAALQSSLWPAGVGELCGRLRCGGHRSHVRADLWVFRGAVLASRTGVRLLARGLQLAEANGGHRTAAGDGSWPRTSGRPWATPGLTSFRN